MRRSLFVFFSDRSQGELKFIDIHSQCHITLHCCQSIAFFKLCHMQVSAVNLLFNAVLYYWVHEISSFVIDDLRVHSHVDTNYR